MFELKDSTATSRTNLSAESSGGSPGPTATSTGAAGGPVSNSAVADRAV
jgi:hypothetical protein